MIKLSSELKMHVLNHALFRMKINNKSDYSESCSVIISLTQKVLQNYKICLMSYHINFDNFRLRKGVKSIIFNSNSLKWHQKFQIGHFYHLITWIIVKTCLKLHQTSQIAERYEQLWNDYGRAKYLLNEGIENRLNSHSLRSL